LINGVQNDSEGGCIFTDTQNLTLDGCLISKCKAKNRGGAIMSWRNVTLIHSTVSDSVITGTSDYINGGGIYSARHCRIEYSNIINNHGAYSGSGAYCNYSATVIKSTISYNSARGHGGGIYSNKVTVSESNVTNNSAKRGGGIYVYAGSTIDKSQFSYNSAFNGAGYYASKEGTKITNSLFSYNKGIGKPDYNYDARNVTLYSSGNAYIINNNFIENEGEVGAAGIILNNIFKSSADNDLILYGDTKLYNNYIDYTKINQNDQNLIKRNNLQPIRVGDIKLWRDDLTLKTDSPAINAGLDPSNSLFEATIDNSDVYDYLLSTLENDIFLNRRDYNNTTIDVGAAEYGYADYPLNTVLTPVIMYLLN
jgi:predicted outer membrane repeat protein